MPVPTRELVAGSMELVTSGNWVEDPEAGGEELIGGVSEDWAAVDRLGDVSEVETGGNQCQ